MGQIGEQPQKVEQLYNGRSVGGGPRMTVHDCLPLPSCQFLAKGHGLLEV